MPMPRPSLSCARLGTATAILLVASAALAQPVARQAPPDPLERINESIDALTRKVWPSVVQILVSSSARRRARPGAPGPRAAAVDRLRVRIDAEGYIMTNAHVISGARRVQIVLPADHVDGTLATALSGRTKLMTAQIVGVTTELDLALLKIDGIKLPALPLATYSQVRQGETGLCVRQPERTAQQPDPWAGVGGRATDHPDSPLIYVQTDAPINPGNSEDRWSTPAAKWSASTRSSCRSRAATKASVSRFPARRSRTASAAETVRPTAESRKSA